MQVSAPGRLELVERPTPTPGPGEVLIEVQACGICGADVNDIEKSNAPGANATSAWARGRGEDRGAGAGGSVAMATWPASGRRAPRGALQ